MGAAKAKVELVEKYKSIFPEYWDYVTEDRTDEILRAGQELKIVDLSKVAGVFYAAHFDVTKPNCIMTIRADDSIVVGIPENLYKIGYVNAAMVTTMPVLTRYDDTAPRYVIAYTPRPPPPFSDVIYISIFNPNTVDITYSLTIIYELYTDDFVALVREAFLEEEEE
jgi:hypothetical protein